MDPRSAVRAPRGLLEPIAGRVQPDLSRFILELRTEGPALVGAITGGWGHRSARGSLPGMTGGSRCREKPKVPPRRGRRSAFIGEER